MFSKEYFCKGNIYKTVRPLLAGLSLNRLSIMPPTLYILSISDVSLKL